MRSSLKCAKETRAVMAAAVKASDALAYFEGAVVNPVNELTWPHIAEGYLRSARDEIDKALAAIERGDAIGWTKHALAPAVGAGVAKLGTDGHPVKLDPISGLLETVRQLQGAIGVCERAINVDLAALQSVQRGPIAATRRGPETQPVDFSR